jgi:chemotaxis protein histidine kinase CheA
MSENPQEDDENKVEREVEVEDDDLKAYLEEMKALETDFSDLEDLDMEELQEIQEAISQVKEDEELPEAEKGSELITREESEVELREEKELRESMVTDFSDMDEIDFDELRDMQAAISTVKQEELKESPDGESEIQSTPEVSKELEDRIKQELLKRKETEEEVITPEKFLDYIKNKRDKIWYHALYYMVFNIEDNIASKLLLYDVLKEVTSKSPIDPIPEHQFYFGLGYILRLNFNNKQVVRFLRDGKFKINVNIDMLKELLEVAGEPISTRPVIKEEEKKKMFKDFLKDDFLDI